MILEQPHQNDYHLKECHTGKFWEFTDKIYPVTLVNAEIMLELIRDTGHFFSFQSKDPRSKSRTCSGMTAVLVLLPLPYPYGSMIYFHS